MANCEIVARAKQPAYTPTELQICKSIVEWVQMVHPHLAADLIHIPNEGRRSWVQGKNLKAIGLRKGMPDYIFLRHNIKQNLFEGQFVNAYGSCGLLIEVKTIKGRETKEQKAYGQRVMGNGYQYSVVRSLDEFIEVFERYIK